MSSQALKVLVLLSTGQQGRAAVNKLSSTKTSSGQAAFNVIALTRSAQSESAKKLAALPNVRVVEGDTSSTDNINKVLKDAGPLDGLVLIQLDADTHPGGAQGETDEAKRVIDAAKAHKVPQIVYHGMELGGVTESDLSYVKPKVDILKYLKEASNGGKAYKWTALQPSNFFENLTRPGEIGFMITWLTVSVKRPVQMVSIKDIAFFGAQALLNPDEYHGREISLAGDLMDRESLEREWKKAKLPEHFLTNTPEEAVKEALAQSSLSTLTDFLNTTVHGQQADVEALRKVDPELLDLANFLNANQEEIKKSEA